MKRINIIYWIVTGLFAAFMIFSSTSNIVSSPEAVAMLHDQLGYPTYFIPFIGVAKLLGSITILVPGFPRLKEWAYSGLLFDLIGATYSFYSIGEPVSAWSPMFIFIGFGFASYLLYHKRAAMKAAQA
ncbi:DoxX family protein [Chryseolinea lacunae]|uniref:DoxX family protein n=1 Tax=Chryseolinea lacunae TaxID=2801331 RepID=A0ABS1KLQ9_9BACT|nr:DoxX family protein [Chryseolinea lacunae]MBL0740400.1 DoxX family protein [Chryseolinea lacunae]